MTRPVLPGADQVERLPAELKRVVPPEFEDLNGHMNVRHYFDLQSETVGCLFRRMGYHEPDTGGERTRGPFTLDQALHYHREVMVGDESPRTCASSAAPTGSCTPCRSC